MSTPRRTALWRRGDGPGALGRDRGATAIEYGLIIGLIALVIFGGVTLLGGSVGGVLSAAGDPLAGSSQAADAAAMAEGAGGSNPAAAAPAAVFAGSGDTTGAAGTSGTSGTAGTTDTTSTGTTGTTGAAADPAGGGSAPVSGDTSSPDPSTPSAGASPAAATPTTTALLAGDWKQVAGAKGSATLAGASVTTTPGTAAIVMNARPWSGPDMTLATTAALIRPDPSTKDGGYALWVRATTNQYGQIESGYTFQVDPGQGNRFNVRVWNNQKQAAAPLVSVPFPAGFDPTAPHAVSVSVVGDRLVATVDGVAVLTIASLSTEVAKVAPTTSVATWVPPTGTGYGLRTWGSTGLDATGSTVQ